MKIKKMMNRGLLAQIEELAAKHYSTKQMCAKLGMSVGSWYKHMSDHPKEAAEIELIIERGKLKMYDLAMDNLLTQLKAGSLKAAIFYLNTKGMWADHSRVFVNDANGQLPEVPASLGTKDPIEASKIYQKLMGNSK